MLALFLKRYEATESKGSFPYEQVQGVSDLLCVGLHEKDDFFSSLTNETISDNGYEAVKYAWLSNQMHTLFDLLKSYSLLDVRPFMEALLGYLKLYQ